MSSLFPCNRSSRKPPNRYWWSRRALCLLRPCSNRKPLRSRNNLFRRQWLRRQSLPRQKVLLYLHGGAYMNPPTSFHFKMLANLARGTGSMAAESALRGGISPSGWETVMRHRWTQVPLRRARRASSR